MRILIRLAALTAAVILVGCSPTAVGIPRDAAATVDGVTVPRSVLEAAVRELVPDEPGDTEERAATVGPVQRQVLSLLVQARIIDNLAEEHSATIDEATVEERFDEQAELAGGEEALASALADSNLTLDLFRDVLLPAQLIIEALRDTVDTVDTRTVRHILLESEAEALDVVAALEGGADFAELAEERSQDPGSAQEGGSLGPAPRGSYVPEFEEAAWAAELGEVVGPVATDFGYHVLEVTDEDELVADDLDEFERDQFVEAELNRLITEAFAEAEVVIGPGLGEWDADQSAVVEPGTVGEGPVAPPEAPVDEPADAPPPEPEDQ